MFITVLCHLLLATFPSKPVISRVQSGEQDGTISLLLLDISCTLWPLEKYVNAVKEKALRNCLRPVLKCNGTLMSASNTTYF